MKDKLAFEQGYKFSIACENASSSGYSTEKIVGAFAAGTVPIYWGDLDIKKIFNEKAFICAADYESLDNLVEAVREVDMDNALYMRMVREPALAEDTYIQETLRELEEFLLHIFEMPLEKCMRRGTVFWQKKYLEDMRRAKYAREYPLRAAASAMAGRLYALIKRVGGRMRN